MDDYISKSDALKWILGVTIPILLTVATSVGYVVRIDDSSKTNREILLEIKSNIISMKRTQEELQRDQVLIFHNQASTDAKVKELLSEVKSIEEVMYGIRRN